MKFNFGFLKKPSTPVCTDEKELDTYWEPPAKLHSVSLEEVTLDPDYLPESVRKFVFSNAYFVANHFVMPIIPALLAE